MVSSGTTRRHSADEGAMSEGYKGIGRKARRNMVRRWKTSGTSLSLKEWAREQGVGDEAESWLKAKSNDRA